MRQTVHRTKGTLSSLIREQKIMKRKGFLSLISMRIDYVQEFNWWNVVVLNQENFKMSRNF